MERQTTISVYRTDELTAVQKIGICQLFQNIFQKEKSVEYLNHQFNTGFPGGGYHCLAENNGEVVGAFSCIPYRFSDHTRSCEIKMAVCVDAMMSKKAGLGPLGMRQMVFSLMELMKKDGIEFLYSFPNDKFYPYNIKALGMRDIGILDFYVLPLAPGKIRTSLNFLNVPVRWAELGMLGILKMFSSRKVLEKRFSIVDAPAFRRQRYDQRHHRIGLPGGGETVYTIYEEDWGPVAYILEVSPLTAWNFYAAFAAVIKEVGSKASMVAYPTERMPFAVPFRMPLRYLPRKLHMVGFWMSPEPEIEGIFELNHWNANLAIFDVR